MARSAATGEFRLLSALIELVAITCGVPGSAIRASQSANAGSGPKQMIADNGGSAGTSAGSSPVNQRRPSCPFPGGRGEPDAASITAAIRACTGAECEAVFGKPERGLFDMIADATGLEAATTVMVGDRLSTDVPFAHNTGMTSALVLTGETDRATLDRTPPDEQPHVVIETLDALLTVAAPERGAR